MVECAHQSIRPLFQKKLKGATYERWLSILQQYNFDLEYKPATKMVVPDALSRCKSDGSLDFSSPDEHDPFFPYIKEETGDIKLPDGSNLVDLLNTSDTFTRPNRDIYCKVKSDNFDNSHKVTVNRIQLLPKLDIEIDKGYDGDTDIPNDENITFLRSKRDRVHKNKTKLNCIQIDNF